MEKEKKEMKKMKKISEKIKN
jgi:hypothetical protein